MKNLKKYAAIAATAMIFTAGQSMAADFADIVFIVDESGSMVGEHAWLGTMVGQLESALQTAGVGDGTDANQYGLIGFGGSGTHYPYDGHSVGGGQWGTAAELSTATSSLVTTGGTEDGWAAINYFFNNYTTRAGAAVNVILVTDEDRDNTDGSLTYNGILSLFGQGALLNAVLDAGFADDTGARAIGIDSDGGAYIADGAGGFTEGTGGVFTGSSYYNPTMEQDYVDLALDTDGAAWDLNLLRAGGLTAESFTNAFIDIKVEEIVNQNPIPEPATMILFGTGLAGLAGLRRRKK